MKNWKTQLCTASLCRVCGRTVSHQSLISNIIQTAFSKCQRARSYYFFHRLQLNIPIQIHSMADDNSDSAKTSFCKSITAMKILHTPRKILFAKNLSLQHTSLPHRIFGKLPFLLEILLNIQTQSVNFKKNKHHITHLPAPM